MHRRRVVGHGDLPPGKLLTDRHGNPGPAAWGSDRGLIRLPSGLQVRGRALGRPAEPADFAVVCSRGQAPAWPYRRVRWPDFWVPLDRQDAIAAFTEALQRAAGGERVEVTCRGGVGRTGTALAALAILDGLPAPDAVPWVRARYHPRAVETPWQRRWLQGLTPIRPTR